MSGYDVQLFEEPAPAGGTHWLAVAPALRGCNAIGGGQDEAIARLQDAMDAWLDVARRQGANIPSEREFPSTTVTYLPRAGAGPGVTAKQAVPTERVQRAVA